MIGCAAKSTAWFQHSQCYFTQITICWSIPYSGLLATLQQAIGAQKLVRALLKRQQFRLSALNQRGRHWNRLLLVLRLSFECMKRVLPRNSGSSAEWAPSDSESRMDPFYCEWEILSARSKCFESSCRERSM